MISDGWIYETGSVDSIMISFCFQQSTVYWCSNKIISSLPPHNMLTFAFSLNTLPETTEKATQKQILSEKTTRGFMLYRRYIEIAIVFGRLRTLLFPSFSRCLPSIAFSVPHCDTPMGLPAPATMAPSHWWHGFQLYLIDYDTRVCTDIV